ncbi:MAG: hypothetical protein MHMPM18_001079 [Marteilia pararefringens]
MRELLNGAYRAYKAKKKPLLTTKHIQARLSYSKKIIDIPEDHLNHIIFSDETGQSVKDQI